VGILRPRRGAGHPGSPGPGSAASGRDPGGKTERRVPLRGVGFGFFDGGKNFEIFSAIAVRI
jgi:hypothetical protein